MRRADRLLNIAHFLRSRRSAVTAREIAEEFQVCTRTIYRDIEDLVYSGAPINGEAGVGYIIDKQYYLPPITFDPDELEAIGLGIGVVSQWTDARFAAKAESALRKIEAVLPASLQGELQQVTTYSRPTPDTIPWSVSFSDVREAIRTRRKLFIAYSDESGQRTTRIIRPLALIFFSPVWLLATWCEKREDFRNFRLDRIRTLELTEDMFEDEPDKNLAAYRAVETEC